MLAILAIGAVSASEDISDDVAVTEPSDEIILEESADDSQEEEILSDGGSSLTDFKNEIMAGGEINLDHDYEYSSGDADFTNITTQNQFVLNGNGHVIDGKGKDMHFLIKRDDSVIKNTVFKNFYRSPGTSYDSFIRWYSSNGRLENCTFENIDSASAGVIHNNWYDFDIVNCTFKDCDVPEDVVYDDVSGSQIMDCTFINNNAKRVVYMGNANAVDNCRFTGNTATSVLLYAGGRSNPQFTNCNFTNNKLDGGSYLIFMWGPNSTIINCNFKGNNVSESGEMVVYASIQDATIKDCTFEGNRIEGESLKPILQIGRFVSGSYYSSNVSLEDSIFKDNSGLAVLWNSESGNILGCTFTNNTEILQSNGYLYSDDEFLNFGVKVFNGTILGYPFIPYSYHVTNNTLAEIKYTGQKAGNIAIYLNGIECYNKELSSAFTSVNLSALNNVSCGLVDIMVKFLSDEDDLELYTGKVFIDYYVSVSDNGTYVSPHQCKVVYIQLPKGATGALTVNDGISNRSIRIYGDGYADFTINGSNYGLGRHDISISLTDDPRFPDKTLQFYFNSEIGLDAPSCISEDEDDYLTIDLPDDYDGTVTILNKSDDGYSPGSVIKEISGLKGISKVSLKGLFNTPGYNSLFVNCSGLYIDSFGLTFVENDPQINASLDSSSVEFGNDVIVTVLAQNSSTLVGIYVDGEVFRYYSGNTTFVFNIPELSVGQHAIKVLAQFQGNYIYSKQFPVNVTKKVEPVKPVTVPAKIVAKDYSAYYNQATYSVTVYGTNGKVANGASVVFKINGKKVATVKTNSKGVAKLKIPTKYVPKTYKITATALGKSVTKKLVIKQVLTLKAATVKRSAKSLAIYATLKEGKKAIKAKKIVFKFNGKTYSAKTNSKGIAKITISKAVLKKLKVGKKIAYQATYIKATVKRTAKVRK